MKVRQIMALAVLTTTLTACAGGPKVHIDDTVRQSIKTVAIDSTVDVPDSIHFNSATQNVSANFGLIGMFMGDKNKRERTDALEAAMKNHGIDVPDMVYRTFSKEMALRTPYKPLKQNSASDATMSIDVHLYGLDVAGAGSRMYPQFTVSAEMKNTDGKIIWRNRATVGPLQKENQAKYTYDELIARPARLEEIMQSAAALTAKAVLADL